MFNKIFQLLDYNHRKRFFSLQFMVILTAVFELISIASIGPFMAIVTDPILVEENSFVKKVYAFFDFSSINDFLFFAGIFVLFLIGFSALISIMTNWRLALFAMDVGVKFGDKLYSYYLNQNWLFHTKSSSANLTKKISIECNRITFDILLPIMNINARIFTSIFVFLALFLYQPLISIIGFFVFSLGYILIYFFVRVKLKNNSFIVSSSQEERFRLMSEGFGGIKDLILLNRKFFFESSFLNAGNKLARAQGVNTALGQVPRYFMEFLAFGSMMVMLLTLLHLNNGKLSEALPVISIYALAGFKILPSLQQIYYGLSQIKSASSAFFDVREDLIASIDLFGGFNKKQNKKINFINGNLINLKSISFSYDEFDGDVIKNVSLSIPINSTVAFVGKSGSGKSTIVDIIMGLLKPNNGGVFLDEAAICDENIESWRSLVGYVPQSIFVSQGTIAENVAFGISPKEIDYCRVLEVLKLANLNEMIDSLPEGINTKVGERGVKISGGQRQRLGIARALYHDAKILIFDEATSALDGITENLVMDAINNLSGSRTIILIAHRLKTIEKCKVIFLMDKGKLVDQGSYMELIESNADFRMMSNYS